MDEHDLTISFWLMAFTVETLGGLVVTVVTGTGGSELIGQIDLITTLTERLPHSFSLGGFLSS